MLSHVTYLVKWFIGIFRAQQYEETQEKVLTERWKAFRLVASIFEAAKSLDAAQCVLLTESFELLSTEVADEPHVKVWNKQFDVVPYPPHDFFHD